jgi:hypothetical protein
MEIINRKKELEKELNEINKKLNETKIEKEKQKNYERFLRRPADIIIGKAHVDHGVDRQGYRKLTTKNLFSVSVQGNTGTTYYPKFEVTETTYTFFHNTWMDQQRYDFQKKLNEIIMEEIDKIMRSSHVIIRLMGLAEVSNYTLEQRYPIDKIEEIKLNIREEQFKLLKDFDLKELIDLFLKLHGTSILKRYFKHKEAIGEFPKIEFKCYQCQKETISFDKWISRSICEKCEYQNFLVSQEED